MCVSDVQSLPGEILVKNNNNLTINHIFLNCFLIFGIIIFYKQKSVFDIDVAISTQKIYLIWRACYRLLLWEQWHIEENTEAWTSWPEWTGWRSSSPEWHSLAGVFGYEATEFRVRLFGGRTLRLQLPIRKLKQKISYGWREREHEELMHHD